ncbi:MAG: hypothetical protein ABUK01_08800 [Leptospirales bacterium]
MKKILERLNRAAQLRNILTLLALQTLLQIVLLGWFLPQLQGPEKSFDTLDLRFSYSTQDVRDYFLALGAPGRLAYTFNELVDLIFGLVYVLSFIFIIAALGRMAFSEKKFWYWFYILPLVLVTCDYIENFSILAMIANFPENIHIAPFASFFTSIKQIVLATTIFLIMGMGLAAFKKKLFSIK